MVSNTLKISEQPALKYPRSIAFIISSEFCERFNYYGMRTILVLYLTRKLAYDDDTATVLYHIFTSLAYFFPLIGAIIADSWLGRFQTVIYLSIVYSIGTVLISLGAIPPLQLPATVVTVIGLLLIAIGTGGIKPCVSAFGGDQFKIPEQAKQLATFFSLFYFSINAGSLISTSVTPILREDVHCFGENGCFSLAFGVPAVLMILSIVLFVLGKSLYTIKKPAGNMIVSVSKCITEAIRRRSQEKSVAPREHWLDYAETKHGKKLVNDTKSLLKILVLYLPLPVFWALFDQQGSRWTFQATRMVGDVGLFVIKPDQMQVINPLLILVFIPLFDYTVYPLLSKIGIKRPLQKLTLGGLLAAAAFVLSAMVELSLQKSYPVLPGHNEAQLRIINGMPCPYHFTTNLTDHTNITEPSLDVFEEKHIPLMGLEVYSYEATSDGSHESCGTLRGFLYLQPGAAASYFIMNDESGANLIDFKDSPDKTKSGFPAVRILANVDDTMAVILRSKDNNITLSTNTTDRKEILPGKYDLIIDDRELVSVDVKLGGVYTFIVEGTPERGFTFKNYVVTEPNSIHMLWQLPQYIIMTAGEVLFSVTGIEFSFTQAPTSMKSVLQACWLLTVAIGNLIVVLIAEFRIFESQAAEFFLFAVLMVVDMGVFIMLAMRYKYITHSSDSDEGLSQIDAAKAQVHQGTNASKSNGHTNEGYVGD